MRKDKDQAIALRKEGKSYNEIVAVLGISKATLWAWFHDIDWSSDVKITNTNKVMKIHRERLFLMNRARSDSLTLRYKDARTEAEQEFLQHRKNPLFVGALMLYMGEGDKVLDNGAVRITNSDAAVLRIFLRFLVDICNIPKTKVHAWILAYPDMSPETFMPYWEKAIGLPKESFFKTQIIQGRHKTKRLHYGVGTVTIGHKRLKVKILCWIELLCNDLIS